jgi:glycosyltransferase involved in cell wall biosynthesis
MNPKLTIGISFKNPGKYFEAALKSVFAQTFTDWELILMDDGSTDSSVSDVRQIKDPRVRLYVDGRSTGLSIRLNQMVQLAQTPYFFRMDADDIMHPERVAKQYQALIDHDCMTVIGTAAYSIDEDSKIVGFRTSRSEQQYGFNATYSFIHPTVAASTAWFRDNPYSEDFIYQRSEDTELWCRTTAKTKFVNLVEPLLYYREDKSLSIKKYVSTSLGIVFLIIDLYSYPRWKFIVLYIRELAKLSIALALYNLGLYSYLIGRRYVAISPEQLQDAQLELSIIIDQEIPMCDQLMNEYEVRIIS